MYDKGKNKKLMGLQAYMAQTVKRRFTTQATLAMSEAEESAAEEKFNLMKQNTMGFSVEENVKDSALDFRSNFIDEYGVSIEFPAFYSRDGCLAPHANGFVVNSGFHVIPRNNDQVVQIT